MVDQIHIIRSHGDISRDALLKADLVLCIHNKISIEVLKDRFDALRDTKDYEYILSNEQVSLLHNIAECVMENSFQSPHIKLTTAEKFTLCFVMYHGYYRESHRSNLFSLRKKYIEWIQK